MSVDLATPAGPLYLPVGYPFDGAGRTTYFDPDGIFEWTTDPDADLPCLHIMQGGLYLIRHKLDWGHNFTKHINFNRVSFNSQIQAGTIQSMELEGNAPGGVAWWNPPGTASDFDLGGNLYRLGNHATTDTSLLLLTGAGADPYGIPNVYVTVAYTHDKGSDAEDVYVHFACIQLTDDPTPD